LSNDTIPDLVAKWKEANITHLLLTFIIQLDPNQPLTDAYSMTQAYKSLTPANQQLIRDNFTLGVSLGGANMISPYSNTFQPGAYYANDPEKYAQDFIALCGDLDVYYDLDIEHIDNQFDATAEFLGRVCIELKRLRPGCQVSHSPQTPYLCSNYGYVYLKIYESYHEYFDFFNLQYYNNGPSQTYQEIFITSNPLYFPNTAIQQLINTGIHPSYLVMGKPVNSSEGSAGYVPLVPDLVNIVTQAFANPDLKDWAETGGVMIWYYDTQKAVSVDNDNLLSYMQQVSYLSA
jgi:hypothetical protein